MTALAIFYSRLFERAVYPILVALQTIPKVALAPLLVIYLGYDFAPKCFLAFLLAYFPVVIATVVGLQALDKGMVNLVRSMGASESQIFFKIRLPAALPNIFGGFKVAISLAVIGAVIGEYVAAERGLGYLQLQATSQFDTTLSFAAVGRSRSSAWFCSASTSSRADWCSGGNRRNEPLEDDRAPSVCRDQDARRRRRDRRAHQDLRDPRGHRDPGARSYRPRDCARRFRRDRRPQRLRQEHAAVPDRRDHAGYHGPHPHRGGRGQTSASDGGRGLSNGSPAVLAQRHRQHHVAGRDQGVEPQGNTCRASKGC